MTKDVVLFDLFSGIGGFAKGIQDAGFNITKHYFSEIDKHAIANYKYNFKNAIYAGSVDAIQSGDIERPDIVTFGSPCQDFSLAGKRRGMEGERSSLILHAIRLITEIRPSVFIWENVKGAFSSYAGADFWAILQAFANIGGYRLEWQLLNTKWFLPQNRERIYLVGHLAGSERSFGNVFPISEDNFGINERSIETRNIRTLTAGGNSGGLHSSMTLVCDSGKSRQLVKRKTMATLRANTGAGHGNYVIQKTGGYCTALKFNEVGTLQASGSNVMDKVPNVIVPYSMGSSKPGRPCINSGRIPEIGNEEKCLRRLTEIECERLQGFPDDWTKYGNYDGNVKEIPKTQRYKMLGNAVTVSVVEEVAKRIKIINHDKRT